MPRGSSPTIQEFRVRAVRVPMTEPHQTASGVVAESPLVLTDVITDAGISGHSLTSGFYDDHGLRSPAFEPRSWTGIPTSTILELCPQGREAR